MARIPAVKGKQWWWWGLTGVALVSGLVLTLAPGINAAVMHGIDRFKNGLQANKELKELAKTYRFQVARQLSIDPDRVGKNDLLLAASINPQLARVVQEAKRREGDDNRFSMMTSAAGVVPFVGPVGAKIAEATRTMGTVAKAGVQGAAAVAAGTGGGLLAGLMGQDHVDPHDVGEMIEAYVLEARQQGADPRRAVNPVHVFMLRVSQDEAFGEAIKQQYGKAFHKMTEQEQVVVMQAFPALASASVAEAYAVGSGVLPVQEMVASAPNLNGMASRVASQRQGSFAARETQRRAQMQNAANIPSV